MVSGNSISYNPTFNPTNDDDAARQSFLFEETVVARFVEFTATDNFFMEPGDGSNGETPGGDRVGLGEIAFEIDPAPRESGGVPRDGLGWIAGSGSSGALTEPTVVNFGPLSGDATYEFSFNAVKGGGSTAIAGSDAWALKLDQWQDQGLFGPTEFGVADHVFEPLDGKNVDSVFERDVHVVIVNDTAAGEARLYLNGEQVGFWLGNFELAGEVGLMAARLSLGDAMGDGSIMYGWATYNSALTDENIALLASPVEKPRPPAPMDVGFSADGNFSLTIPDGTTADIEYSQDLQNWEVIANDVMGVYEDSNTARLGNPVGYYRANP